jgi:hypothetical protein
MANRLLAEAARHLHPSGLIALNHPAGAYQLGYDAARKAALALLVVQGLRVTSRGGHIALQTLCAPSSAALVVTAR